MKWEKKKIEDICLNITSGGTPKSTNEAFYNPQEIPWLKTGEVNYCRIYDTEKYISKEGLYNSSAKIIPTNSVIVAMYGQGDTAGRVAINKIPLTTNQACCNLIINDKVADCEFVYYKLSTLYEKMVSLKNGGAQPNLNVKIIKSIEISLPPLPVQQRIASILSTYDDLIENNQKQIKLLEEAAQRLYKEWFVDLHFPGHENVKIVDGVPEGWESCKLRDVAEINGRNIDENYPYDKINYIDIASVRNGRILEKANYNLEEAPGRAKRIVQDGDVIWGMVRPNLRAYAMVLNPDKNDVFSPGFAVLTSKKVPFSFLYCNVTTEEFVGYLVNCTNGAAYPAVKPIHFEEYNVSIPQNNLLNKFHNITEPYFRKIYYLSKQISSLREARDRLLPKLMSGEIEV
ncbi:restriction endonuclease subunit S [Phascolarctobacterium sp. Marseille-Q4147]|uniref:restriction endonuclease subunit S n=1 Tax=Phascolarctobacterium sp. Marseille-Q4147 TaxID=2823317 RepID=UPI001B32EF1A|nr:restriction endonuclease subunit S [Phascolarctobacterium sp. Marseille-Q4147]QTV78355.1 restriction endonuclease subunit S [Phascolarctobacterium sp. Marseille-Q4147]